MFVISSLLVASILSRFIAGSMMLINSLLAHATDTLWEAFIAKLEKLNIRKAVIVRPVPIHCIRP